MHHAKVVINQLLLPMQRSDYAMDLNGDGKLDNAFGNIVGALSSQGIDIQGQTNAAIAAGQDVMLLDVGSMDPTFTNDSCGDAVFYNGVNQTSPSFDGGTAFTVDNTVPSTLFTGSIVASAFSSLPLPPMQTVPEQLRIKLPLFGLTPVTLIGAHLQWKYAGGDLTQGRVNGAITNQDVQDKIIPAIAAQLNQQIQANPNSSSSMQIKQIFDVGDGNGGNCMDKFGTGVPNDGVIAACEVSGNSIIKNVLAPDVQMFQNGVYKPSAANTMKDSLSVGLAFTAVPASF